MIGNHKYSTYPQREECCLKPRSEESESETEGKINKHDPDFVKSIAFLENIIKNI